SAPRESSAFDPRAGPRSKCRGRNTWATAPTPKTASRPRPSFPNTEARVQPKGWHTNSAACRSGARCYPKLDEHDRHSDKDAGRTLESERTQMLLLLRTHFVQRPRN